MLRQASEVRRGLHCAGIQAAITSAPGYLLNDLPLTMVLGVLQFLHAFSDRLGCQDKSHPHFLHIKFHQSNYVGFCPLFALAGKHGMEVCGNCRIWGTVKTCSFRQRALGENWPGQ